MTKRFLTVLLSFISTISWLQVTTISQTDIGTLWYSGVDDWGGQSFTIPSTGQLSEIRFHTQSPEGPAIFEIRQGQSITGPLVYATGITISASGWFPVPLPGIMVCQGDVYSFFISGFQYGSLNSADPYPGGCAIYQGSWVPGFDMAFEVDQVVDNSPLIDPAIPDLDACAGSPIAPLSFTLNDTIPGAVVISASSSNTTLIANADLVIGGSGLNKTLTFSSTPAITGTSTISITLSDGVCTSVHAFTVNVHGPPVIDAGSDVATCEGDYIILSATGADTYLWNTGDGNNAFVIPPPGTTLYSVTGTDLYGCQGTDNLTVIVQPKPIVTVSADQFFCKGDTLTLTAAGADSYYWQTGSDSSTTSIAPLLSQSVSVVGETNGCSDTSLIHLTYDDPAQVDAGPDQLVCNGFSVLLSASGGVSYEWSGPNVSTTPGPNLLVNADTTAYYYAAVQTSNGCIYTDSVLVTADQSPDCTIDALNSFTPNGDAVNEYWRIQGIESFPQNHVTILNRWGDVVFERDNYNNGNVSWTGTELSGDDAPGGTYFFVIEIVNGPSRSGWIQLFR